MENLKEEICAFLKGKGAGAKLKALEIAKGVGQTTAKDVNKALYDLQRAGCLQKAEGQPPLWSLGGSCRSTGVDVAPNSIGTPSKQEIKEILRSHTGGEGITAKKLARDLNQPRKSVNSQLYGMLKSGEVERMSSSRDDASLWKWCDENGSRNNMKEESCDSADDSSGWTIDECSDSGTLVSGDTAVSRFQEDYSTFEKLGTGGFGAIYKAERNLDKKYYAIKVVKYHQYASREVEALAKFDHSNIVRYYTAWTESSRPPSRKSTELSGEEESGEEESGEEESGEEESGEEESSVPNRSNTPKMYLYIQMELCDRGTLTKWIENRNHGEVKIKKEPLEIFYKILNGVEYIHSQEHIHRDLKPDNILFGSDGTVKIGDFGLVTVIKNKNGASVKRTMNIGTESYMSPEQEDQSTYDEKVDIFALGLIFFELLWTVGSGMERAKLWPDLRRAEFPREFCSEFTSEHAVIRKMLSQAPGERPSAKAIAMKLKKASNQTR